MKKKVTFYFDEGLYQDISDMANFSGVRISEYLFEVLSKEIKQNADKLEKFRELRGNNNIKGDD
ncbi:MAG: hypothetical protein IJP96_00790 [Synergistaceae bacterium]|nr:hypothetical protein [Synergistaceae bacterium]MBR0074275.1 hypothetical protein [Synergistaceae bacterium]MBR0232851.1 hypothetical protein [Synergistaceae bacterium]